MKTQKIKKGTTKLTDLEFETFVEHILVSMTGNTHFPTPSPTLASIAGNRTTFNDLMVTIQSGNYTKSQVADKDALRDVINAQLDQLIGYVNGVAGSNISIATTSGFPLAKESTPVGDLPAPVNFSAKSLASGSVTLRCKALHGADSYMFQYTTSPSPEVNNWVSITHSGSRLVVTDLTPGTQYKFRVCGVGAKGAGQWAMAMCYVNF